MSDWKKKSMQVKILESQLRFMTGRAEAAEHECRTAKARLIGEKVVLRERAEKADRERDELSRDLESERYQRRAFQASEAALAAHVGHLRHEIGNLAAADFYMREKAQGVWRAYDSTPAASLAAHDAKLLRRAARKIGPDCDRKTDADILLDKMADAIERGDA